MKRIVVSVSNDLATDQRVSKVCNTLKKNGYSIILVGRKLKNSLPIERDYKTKRFRLLFKKGPIFYAEYNLRLFFFLLFAKAEIFLSNDLDTLLANYTASRIRRKKIIYDSHEYFTGVPEIQNRPFVKNAWETIEKNIFPKLGHVYTVNDSIAKLYADKYGKEIHVIRNVSRYYPITQKQITKKQLGLDIDKKIIIIQGAGINVDRGAEELVSAMEYIEKAILIVVGGGDVLNELKRKVENQQLEEKVFFFDKKPYEIYMQYTQIADIGASLDKDTNINYKFSLPNKIFDYIQAETPVICSNLIEVAKIVRKYNVGVVVESHEPKSIADEINKLLSDDIHMKELKKNLKRAKEELCWEKEEKKLIAIFEQI